MILYFKLRSTFCFISLADSSVRNGQPGHDEADKDIEPQLKWQNGASSRTHHAAKDRWITMWIKGRVQGEELCPWFFFLT